jgi:hypothetical protein
MLDAQETLTAQSRMESSRSGFDRQWQDAAELFLPRQADFYNAYRQQGEDRSNRIFDSYGAQAADDGTAVFEGYVMPKGALWQLMTVPGDRADLANLQHVREWFETKTKRLHMLRNNAMSGFATESNESAASLMVFGNQGMEVEPLRDPMLNKPVGLRYRSEHIGRIYFEEDWQGLPGRRHVKTRRTAKQALERFGAALERAPQIMNAASDPKRANTEFELLRVILPNPAIDPGRLDYLGKPWLCGFLSVADKEFIEIGGYRAAPLTCSRFQKSPTETYGRGPGINILPDIKAAQAIMIDLMVGAEMSLRPPLGAPDDATDMLINYAAGEVTYGAIDARGNRLIQPLMEIGDMAGALKIQEQIHGLIDRAFYRHLLFTNQDMKSHVTDGQLYERTQEKGVLLSPLSRQETEWFTPMLDREVDVMAQMGEFDDMPGELQEAGGIKHVMYDNPLNRALRAEQAGGYFRALDKVVAVAQYDPSALQTFFREYPLAKAIRGIGDIEAIPASWAATDAEKAAFDKAQAAQKQAQDIKNLADTAEPIGRAAKDFSQATANAA